jgi:hypothetical protein
MRLPVELAIEVDSYLGDKELGFCDEELCGVTIMPQFTCEM